MIERDKMRLALETGFCLTTITKWDRGRRLSKSADLAITRAACKLAIAPGQLRKNQEKQEEADQP
jgi:hypothetical protein